MEIYRILSATSLVTLDLSLFTTINVGVRRDNLLDGTNWVNFPTPFYFSGAIIRIGFALSSGNGCPSQGTQTDVSVCGPEPRFIFYQILSVIEC
jgi:hypothetical protein